MDPDMRQQSDMIKSERRETRKQNGRKMRLRGKRLKTNQAEAEAKYRGP